MNAGETAFLGIFQNVESQRGCIVCPSWEDTRDHVCAGAYAHKCPWKFSSFPRRQPAAMHSRRCTNHVECTFFNLSPCLLFPLFLFLFQTSLETLGKDALARRRFHLCTYTLSVLETRQRIDVDVSLSTPFSSPFGLYLPEARGLASVFSRGTINRCETTPRLSLCHRDTKSVCQSRTIRLFRIHRGCITFRYRSRLARIANENLIALLIEY